MNEMICYNCGNESFENDFINKVFNINGKVYSVENIPALICTHCQEPLLLPETAEKIRVLLNSNTKPIRKITAKVYDYAV